MVLRLTSHWGEESKMIFPGFKTTKPQKSKTKPKSKEKENGKNTGCYILVWCQRYVMLVCLQISKVLVRCRIIQQIWSPWSGLTAMNWPWT
jgi:hypothetical protein